MDLALMTKREPKDEKRTVKGLLLMLADITQDAGAQQ